MTKRIDLREFQQKLIERLQAKDTQESIVSNLGVQIAGANWVVDISDISEVLPLPILTPVPFSKPWFRGVVNVRGNLYGVTDLAAYMQSGVVSGDSQNRVLLVAERYAFNSALLVDRVIGLRDINGWQLNQGINNQIEYRDEQGSLWYKLDIKGLLEQAEFLQIST